jgi:phenylacetate-coenzyme A ligase PaaK-like adenylate-forming protein
MDIATLNIQQIVHYSSTHFNEIVFDVFHYQAQNNVIYKDYIAALGVVPKEIQEMTKIPFLPISFFKSHDVRSGLWHEEATFSSSGTTGTATSKHAVKSVAQYVNHTIALFESQYGSLKEYCILGLLPSYLERSGSGLITMVEGFMHYSQHPKNGYFLYDHQALSERLIELEASGQKTLLIGVTFALLDFAEAFPQPLKSTIVMETGGMKGRGRELTRDEVHNKLQTAFSLSQIHSEYGMTELSSQAYSKGNGLYSTGLGLNVLVRETTDPLSCYKYGSGGLNIIDLANLHTCSFIATEDLGKIHPNGQFEVLGRFDQSDARGCNLMVV